MQEVTALPSIITVQQPQAPWSQPILSPVSSRRSRRVWARVSLSGMSVLPSPTGISYALPFTVSAMIF